jgi:predicted metalloprotease with PDZ domain
LNDVAAYDWRRFFQSRVYTATARAPLGGIEWAGWVLAYTNIVPEMLRFAESAHKYTDLTHSLGLIVKEDGAIQDVIPGSPADKAGVAVAMKLMGVNSRHWTPELLRGAVAAAQTNRAPVELLLENEEFFLTCKVDYHDGERYAILERDSTKPDLLAKILQPLAAPVASGK